LTQGHIPAQFVQRSTQSFDPVVEVIQGIGPFR